MNFSSRLHVMYKLKFEKFVKNKFQFSLDHYVKEIKLKNIKTHERKT